MNASPFEGLGPLQPGSTLGTELWIAWGHLRSRQYTHFINVITTLSVLGVLVGVAVLNCVVAVMTGFEIELIDKILGANAHVVVMRQGGGGIPDGEALADRLVQDTEGVVAASPFVYFEVIARTEDHHTGVIIKGVDPARTGPVTHLLPDLVVGMDGPLTTEAERLTAFARIAEALPGRGEDTAAFPAIFVGQALLNKLHVGVGDKIQLMNPVGGGEGGFGIPIPKVKTFRVGGVFDSGMHEYDQRWTYISNQAERDFLEMGDLSLGIELTVQDIYGVEAVTERLNAELGYPYVVSHWKDLNGKLFGALKQEKYVASLVSTMIIFIASLLIVSTLIMVVLTRGREIAVLKAMGASQGMVLRIFLFQAAFIGLFGVSIGTALGIGAALALRWYGWGLETDAFFLTELPVVIDPLNVVLIAVGAFGLCLLAAVVPALLAARLDAIELLRYE